MKLLHTSDWHLGRNLYGHKRLAEYGEFLDWLAATVAAEEIDILCVAGDVFDTTTPNNRVQSLYFSFLRKLLDTKCRKLVITGGNHDSPSLLEAPRALLREMNIEVIGRSGTVEDEIIIVHDDKGLPAALICAVPFLRDQDIRTATAGENIEEKQQKLLEGIHSHYAEVASAALKIKDTLAAEVPVIGMGHLFAAGGKCHEGDGVRDLYVGNLVHVRADDIPELFDYLALGHLHRPQRVAGREHWRYSGSPMPMNFNEAESTKEVVIVEFTTTISTIRSVPVPCFRRLISITGNFQEIAAELELLLQDKQSAWLEIIYRGESTAHTLNTKLFELIAGSSLEIVRIVNKRLVDGVLLPMHDEENLEALSVNEVFRRCLELHDITEDTRKHLEMRFNEALNQTLSSQEGEDGGQEL